MNPQDQNTYVGPPPRAIDPNAPQDPYLAQNQPNIAPVANPNQPMVDQNQAYQNPNQYNTPELAAQIQMAQQAGQAAQAQTVSAQMMASQPQQTTETGEPGKQVYKAPLVISNSVARAFAYIAILTIVIAVVNFIVKQFATEFEGDSIYATILAILSRVNTVTLFARIAVVGFAVAATVIRVYNPHPYNTKNAIAGWIFALLSLVALLIFR